MVKLKQNQIDMLSCLPEVWISLPYPKGPRGGTCKESIKNAMMNRYHLIKGSGIESEDALFYNSDLRSQCGCIEEYSPRRIWIRMWPKHYASDCVEGKFVPARGDFATYWKNLLMDADEVSWDTAGKTRIVST